MLIVSLAMNTHSLPVHPFFIDHPFSRATADVGGAFGALPIAWQFAFTIAFGLAIGSFLNVVIHRLPIILKRAWQAELSNATGQSSPHDAQPPHYNLCTPRSACPQCGHQLRLRENIPVISYLILRGRCAQCRASISLRYLVIELATAALAAIALTLFGPSGAALAAFGFTATLLVLSAIDIETRLLPDALTLTLLWAGLIVNLTDTFTHLQSAVLGAIAGYLFLWCVYWLFRLVRGIEGMGYGDFKLLAALGAWLGWAALPQIVLIAAVTGAIIGLVATWFGRMRFSEPLPFGPFLAASAVATLFAGTPLMSFLVGS